MPGLVFVVTIYTFPYVYIMIANTLGADRLRPRGGGGHPGRGPPHGGAHDHAADGGARLVSGFILAVLQALALFGSPAILALPAGFHTITTQIWSLFQYPPKVETGGRDLDPAAARHRAPAARCRSGCSAGAATPRWAARAGSGARSRSGAWRWPALRGCLAVMACAIFLPYGILAKAALRARVGAAAHVGQLHARQLSRSRSSSTARPSRAIVNTLELGVLTASVGAVLVALLAYVDQPAAGRSATSSWRFLALAPIVIPGVVLAVALFIAYTRPPFVLYGTLCDPVRRLPDQGDAGRLRAVRRDVPRHPARAGGGRPHPGRRAPARAARRSPRRWPAAGSSPRGASSSSASSASCRPRSSCSRPNTKVMSVVIFDLKEEGQFGAIAVLGPLHARA